MNQSEEQPVEQHGAVDLSQRAARRRQLQASRGSSHGFGGLSGFQSERELRQGMRKANEELSSLREVYARQIANTEASCDRLRREKDDECAEWYKHKKYEMKRMAAALVIMKALFESKRQKLKTQMEDDKADFERHKSSFRQETEMLKAESRTQLEKCSMELAEKTKSYEERLTEISRDRNELRERVACLDKDIAEQALELEDSQRSLQHRAKETEDLKRRLMEAQQEAEVARRNSRVEELEAELQRTKRTMQERARREAEALRKELMDYVQFIVQILPDDWRERNLNLKSTFIDYAMLPKEGCASKGMSPSGQFGECEALSSGDMSPLGRVVLPSLSKGLSKGSGRECSMPRDAGSRGMRSSPTPVSHTDRKQSPYLMCER